MPIKPGEIEPNPFGYESAKQQHLGLGDIVVFAPYPKQTLADVTQQTSWSDSNAYGTIYVAEITRLPHPDRIHLLPDDPEKQDRLELRILTSVGNSENILPPGETTWVADDYQLALIRRATEAPDQKGIYQLVSPDGILPLQITETRQENSSHFAIEIGTPTIEAPQG